MKFSRLAKVSGWINLPSLLRTRWPLLLLTMSAVVLVGALVRSRVPPLYEVVAHLSLGVEDEAAAGEADGFRSVRHNGLSRELAEIGSRSFLAEVVRSEQLLERWGCPDEAEAIARLRTRHRVVADRAGRGLALRARGQSPEDAAALANAIAEHFLARKEAEAKGEATARVHRLEAEAEQRLQEIAGVEGRLVEQAEAGSGEAESEGADLRRRLVSLRNLLHSLEAKRQLAALEAREARSPARLVVSASPERSAAVARGILSLPALVALGAIAGVALLLLSRGRQSRWSAIAELMERLGAPVAGFAPVSGRSIVAEAELPDELAEPYRELRNRLVRLPAGECLFLSMMPQRWETSFAETVVNLACVLADGGSTVLVVDADFRRPVLHGYFGAAQLPGLADYLSGEMRLEETVLRSRRANLWFMPAGPRHPDPGALLNGRRMSDLVWDLRSRFDFVLVASPSIHEVSDAGVLAGLADYVVVVASAHGYSMRRLRETKVALETVPACLGGVVLAVPAGEAGDGETTPNRAREETGAKGESLTAARHPR